MGLFGSKKTSPSAEDLIDARGTAKGLTKKELEELRKKMNGEVSRGGDVKAGLKDLRDGRKGAQGVGKLPQRPEGKGRSMWGKDTPLKKGK